MSKEKNVPSHPSSASNPNALSNPQVLTAIITGIVTLVAAFVGILPTLIQAGQSAPTPTPTPTLTVTHTLTPTADLPTDTYTSVQIQTATFTLVPAASATVEPTQVAPTQVAPTQVAPTATIPLEPTAVPTQDVPVVQSSPPNVMLIYDDAAFSVVNVSGSAMSLEGVRFHSSSGKFNSNKWANYRSVPNNNCIRLREVTAGRRNPPGECKTLLSLLEVGGNTLFWLNTPVFEVVRNGEVLATCTTDTDRCAVFIPQG